MHIVVAIIAHVAHVPGPRLHSRAFDFSSLRRPQASDLFSRRHDFAVSLAITRGVDSRRRRFRRGFSRRAGADRRAPGETFSAPRARPVVRDQSTRPRQRLVPGAIEKMTRQAHRMKARAARRAPDGAIASNRLPARVHAALQRFPARPRRRRRRARRPTHTDVHHPRSHLLIHLLIHLLLLRVRARRDDRIHLPRRRSSPLHVRRNRVRVLFNQPLPDLAHAVHRQRHVFPRRRVQHPTHHHRLLPRRARFIAHSALPRQRSRRSTARRSLPRPLKPQRLHLVAESRDDEHHVARSQSHRVLGPVRDRAVVLRESSRRVRRESDVRLSLLARIEAHDEVTRVERARGRAARRRVARRGRAHRAARATATATRDRL